MIPYSRTETLKNPYTLSRGRYIYSPYKGVPPEMHSVFGRTFPDIMLISPAVSHCPVDVVFIMDSSECVSQATFLKEKNFVKQAAAKLGVPSQSRAAIIQFSRSATVEATFGQYPTKQQFEEAVDGLRHELPRTASFDATTQIDEALNVADRDVFAVSGTSKRRIAVLLTNGNQVISAKEVPNLRTASVNLRKLGIRLLVVTMGTSSSALDTILKSVTERNEDVIMAEQFNDLLNKLPGMIACGKCNCLNIARVLMII